MFLLNCGALPFLLSGTIGINRGIRRECEHFVFLIKVFTVNSVFFLKTIGKSCKTTMYDYAKTKGGGDLRGKAKNEHWKSLIKPAFRGSSFREEITKKQPAILLLLVA